MQGQSSLALSLALLTEQERTAIIRNLSDKEIEELLYDWRFWAREDQIAPDWNWFCWLHLGGRGSGKTRPGSEWIIERARAGYRRHALIGETKADVRDTMIEVGDSAILNVCPPWWKPDYEPSKRRLTWPNETISIIYSGDEPGQLRGPQHDTAWCDELAKFKYPQDTWDNMEFGLRLSENPQVLVSTTPKPIPIIKQLVADPRTALTRASTYMNRHNLAPAFLKRILDKYEGTRLGRQEIHGQILDDNPNALWKRDNLEKYRVTSHPPLFRVGVGVDPEGSDTEESAETGIIVAGVAYIGDVLHGFILEDLTIKGSPNEWGSAAVSGYNKNHADIVVGEVNNGGDMVGFVIQTVDKTVNFKAVRASRGKYTRAEPVAALNEQGRIHHVGFFADLEDQLCEWVPGEKSPDRLDAYVWIITELMLENEGQPSVRWLP